MDRAKDIGMEVHKEAICVAVLNCQAKLVAASRDHGTEGRTILLNGVGWTARKIRPQESCYFLDSFYRANRELIRF